MNSSDKTGSLSDNPEQSMSTKGKSTGKSDEGEISIKKSQDDETKPQVNSKVTPHNKRHKWGGSQMKEFSSNLKTHSVYTPSTATTAPLTDGGSIESNAPNLSHSPHQQFWTMYRFMENPYASPGPLPPYSAATMSSSAKNQSNYHALHNRAGRYLGAITPNIMQSQQNDSHTSSKLKSDTVVSVSGHKEQPTGLSNVVDYHVASSTPISITNIPKRSRHEYDTKTPPILKKQKRSRKERKPMPPLYINNVIYATPHKELKLDRLPKNLDLTPTPPSSTTSSIMHLQSTFEKNTGSKTKKRKKDEHCKKLFTSNQFEQSDIKD